ncbi:ATP-binding cassette domain-containing protein [Pseudarthrobacter sp. J64]|uniref:ABC transporter ATP-binding protein n=1 Tax=Pseudarthrobacter sp. J64 TaxID=3116485 RepID=UPI002E81D519|nr:ATP-binding cassette domain-containing protein [Pseudarthrobacter sp. J64]MEE2569683.1 ATP-binding cassette domain-containing protein [Pseudarthrobacter sp. J64]
MRLSIDSFSYPDSRSPVLAGVEVSAGPGECVLVAGGSGSGKTTLGLILAGVLPGQHRGSMTGTVELGGHVLAFPAAQASRVDHRQWGALAGYAGQDAAAQLSTIASTVEAEIAFPLENAGLPRAEMIERVRETSSALGLAELLGRHPAELSGGQQKLVAIAAAIARRPGYLVLDEPLAGLDLEAGALVSNALRTLVEDGMGVILLSQDLAGAGMVPDRVLLLDAGRAVFEGTRDAAAVQAAVLGVPVLGGAATAPARHTGSVLQPRSGQGNPVVAAEGLRFGYPTSRQRRWRRQVPAAPVVDGVNLTVAAGECVAVAGANGSGKSTLLRLLTGLSAPQQGELSLEQGAAHRGTVLGALLQNPREQLFERTVWREVAAAVPRSVGDAGRALRVDEALGRCGLLDAAEAHPYELPASGQRLTALAALLAQAPRFIALDEPTVSLDGPGLEILGAAIEDEAARGAAIVMVTHDLDFAYRTCARLLVLSQGRPVADGAFVDVLATHFGAGAAFGVAAPAAWLREQA